MQVYVITNPELGWDCVVGVYKAKNYTSEEDVIEQHLSYHDIGMEYAKDYIAHLEELED